MTNIKRECLHPEEIPSEVPSTKIGKPWDQWAMVVGVVFFALCFVGVLGIGTAIIAYYEGRHDVLQEMQERYGHRTLRR